MRWPRIRSVNAHNVGQLDLGVNLPPFVVALQLRLPPLALTASCLRRASGQRQQSAALQQPVPCPLHLSSQGWQRW